MTRLREGRGTAGLCNPLPIPRLATPRLLLIPPSAACEALYQRFYTDADASRVYGGPLSPGGASARLESDLAAWQLQGFGVWVISRAAEGDLLGVCGFWQGAGWPVELTWWLLPEARGRGIAVEASRAALRHAYTALGWTSVETYMNDANEPARALAGRLGGVKVARRVFPDGLERDVFRIPAPASD